MPDLSNMPRHVAFIMDGNGRWATRQGLPRAAGHRAGVKAMKGIIRQSKEWGIGYITFYAFSTENWKRPAAEVSVLMNLLVEFMDRELDEMDRNGVHIRVMGELSRFPARVRAAIQKGVDRTRANTGIVCNIALNYGGRDEIVRAVRAIAADAAAGRLAPESISEDTVAQHLFTAGQPDPDLIVRTSGEMRLSNYLLFQGAYAELIFPEVTWPDFTPEAYAAVIDAYQRRHRRFGGL